MAKKRKTAPYILALSGLVLVALGLFAGHWWALRKPMACACYSQCIVKSPIT